MYVKLENGRLIKAKHFIIDGNSTIINPTNEMYEKHGYKKNSGKMKCLNYLTGKV